MIFQERRDTQVLFTSRMPLQTVGMTDLLSAERKKRSINTVCGNDRVAITVFEHETSENSNEFFAAHLAASVQDPHADNAIAEATQTDPSALNAGDRLKRGGKRKRNDKRKGSGQLGEPATLSGLRCGEDPGRATLLFSQG